MCLFTIYVKNPRYKPNKKNGGIIPTLEDYRKMYIPAKCGVCSECRQQKQRDWIVRLSEELRENNKCLFVTLTFSNENLNKFDGDKNEIATKAVRLFLERCRKKTGKSVKHWFITEIGDEKGRIHLHGFWWGDKSLLEKWEYGHIYIGDYVNEKTIFYVTKYMLKQNQFDKNFVGKVLCSAGIGKNYINRHDAKNNRYKKDGTNETYRLRNGKKINLPQYYRMKIYSEKERDALWSEKLEKGYRYVKGEKVSTLRKDTEEYRNIMEYYQNRDRELYNTKMKYDMKKNIEKKNKINK